MDLVKQLLSNLALLCALLAQCLVATIAPALVMCQESDGGQVLELVLADCCDAPAAPSRTRPVSIHRAREDADRREVAVGVGTRVSERVVMGVGVLVRWS